MPRPKQRTPALREHVLTVAITTLSDDGIAAFTVRRVAEAATTSPGTVYELFGDKAGLVREIYFEGFARLRNRLDELPETADPRADLHAAVHAFRDFGRDNVALADVMFSRPLADFDPGRAEREASVAVRKFFVWRVSRGIDAGLFAGNAIDLAHAVLALAQGLAIQERTGWLGSSRASADRRWKVATNALLDGFAPRDE
jgi:AcrR family transcriptional regulator